MSEWKQQRLFDDEYAQGYQDGYDDCLTKRYHSNEDELQEEEEEVDIDIHPDKYVDAVLTLVDKLEQYEDFYNHCIECHSLPDCCCPDVDVEE